MKRGAWGVGLLALLCIALALLVTSLSETPIARSPDRAPVTPTVSKEPSTGRSDISPKGQPQIATDVPLVLWIFFYALLLALAGLLLWLLWGFVRRQRRRRKQRAAAFTPSDLDTLDADVERRLVDAVQAQLADLGSGSPRNAVVACWLALEEAVRDTGLYRDPSMTSVEFTQEVLEAYTLDEAAIRRLSALYREARFSSHAITELHREAAAGALQTLSAELADRVSSRPRDEEPAP